MNGRGRMAVGALTVLVIYLLAQTVSLGERRRRADLARDRAISSLSSVQDQVVAKLAEILEAAIRAEEAAGAPTGAVERILERVVGLDPALIQRAVEEAQRRVSGSPGPPGPQGDTGPPGPAAAEPSATTTTTAPAASTTTTRPNPTTTTRPCLLSVPGLAKVGCG